jgi:hypothetical protein
MHTANLTTALLIRDNSGDLLLPCRSAPFEG